MAETLHIAFAVDMAGDDRVVRGLAVPFGVDSQPHQFRGSAVRHRFRRGAFTRTVAERGSKVLLMAEHQRTLFPIGRAVELAEEPKGLRAAFELAATARGDEALTLVRDGLVTGLSVSVDPITWSDRHDGVIEHTEVRLREISLVAEPAFVGAGIAASDTPPTLVPLRVDVARLRLRLLEAR